MVICGSGMRLKVTEVWSMVSRIMHGGGWAPMVNQLSRIRSSHDMLERVYNIEAKLGIGLGGGK
jgi:hypothetical protein